MKIMDLEEILIETGFGIHTELKFNRMYSGRVVYIKHGIEVEVKIDETKEVVSIHIPARSLQEKRLVAYEKGDDINVFGVADKINRYIASRFTDDGNRAKITYPDGRIGYVVTCPLCKHEVVDSTKCIGCEFEKANEKVHKVEGILRLIGMAIK